MQEIRKVFNLLSRMTAVTRFSHRKALVDENVLEHTAGVGIIALKIIQDARNIDPRYIDNNDELLLLKSIYLHDMDEIVTGDIPRPTKYALSDLRELLHKIERKGMKQIIEQYDLPSEWMALWSNAKNGKTGLILVISDILSVVYKYWEERIILGNKFFDLVGTELKSELVMFRDSMARHSDDFLSKFSFKIESKYDVMFIDLMVEYINQSMEILSHSDNAEDFDNSEGAIGSFL